jgi:AP-5 complex subunit mu-1
MEVSRPISFRGVFIFSSPGGIIFSHRFPLIESRVPATLPSLPLNDALSAFFKSDVAPLASSQSVFHVADSIELVLMPARTLYIGAIPLIESPPAPGAPHVEVSASFSFLNFYETVSRAALRPVTPQTPPHALAGLRQLVNQILPFGTPLIHDPYFASQLTSPGEPRRFGAGYQAVGQTPVPSWKTFLFFQRIQLDLKLREIVLGSIEGGGGSFDVFGELRCIATMNYLPDVTLTLPWLEDRVQDVSAHFSVKKIEGTTVVFSPATGNSQLLLWRSVVERTQPPVGGRYEIREDDAGLHFALTVSVRPPVKSISAQLPFPGRGAVTKHQFQSHGGQLRMSKKEAVVMWITKLEENGTQTLAGVLNFETRAPAAGDKLRVYITFKSKKRSLSGIALDKDAVGSTPEGTINVTTDASFAAEGKRYVFYETPMPTP